MHKQSRPFLPSQGRAERIARTEAKRAEQAGSLAAVRAAGFRNVVWVAEPDACEFCKQLDGRVVKAGNVFVRRGSVLEGADGGEFQNTYGSVRHPPLHPNCRCVVQPIVRGRTRR